MTTLEEQYSLDVKRICALYPPGSQERETAKQDLWNQFQADRLLRDGKGVDLYVVYKLQKQLATELYELIAAYYNGKVREADYGPERSAAFLRYCSGMAKLGLARGVPDISWVEPFTTDGLAFERGLVPSKTTGLTQEDTLLLLCDPCRNKIKEVISAFHTEFGVGTMRDNPDIFGGILSDLKEGEQTDIAQARVKGAVR